MSKEDTLEKIINFMTKFNGWSFRVLPDRNTIKIIIQFPDNKQDAEILLISHDLFLESILSLLYSSAEKYYYSLYQKHSYGRSSLCMNSMYDAYRSWKAVKELMSQENYIEWGSMENNYDTEI